MVHRSLFQHSDSPLELEWVTLWCSRSWWPSGWCTRCTPRPLTPRRVIWELLPPSLLVSSLAPTFWRVGPSVEHPWTRPFHSDQLLWAGAGRTTGSTGLGLSSVVGLLGLSTNSSSSTRPTSSSLPLTTRRKWKLKLKTCGSLNFSDFFFLCMFSFLVSLSFFLPSRVVPFVFQKKNGGRWSLVVWLVIMKFFFC